jgi:hypothetical protein
MKATTVHQTNRHLVAQPQKEPAMLEPKAFTISDRPSQQNQTLERNLGLGALDLSSARLLCGSRLFVLVAGRTTSFDPNTLEITGLLNVISSAKLSSLQAPAMLRLGTLELAITHMQGRQAELFGEQSVRFTAQLRRL